MKKAADYRGYAREKLRGNWGIALLGGLIAGLLGASNNNVNFNFNFSGINNESFAMSGGYNFSPDEFFNGSMQTFKDILETLLPFLIGAAVFITIFALALSILYFCLGSIINLGYARFNLELVDGDKPSMGSIFDYFPHWKTAIAAAFWQTLFIFLWSLLFVIPGIIAMYRYSMTGYILAENPDMPAREAIERSKEMMSGNKWRLFCLQFSFIGWDFLTIFTLGIGNLWLKPYKEASTAIFYRDISGTGWARYEASQKPAEDAVYEEVVDSEMNETV